MSNIMVDNTIPSNIPVKIFKFSCARCGHGFDLKANLTSHLRNKMPCPAKLQDVSREALLEQFKNPTPKNPQVECIHCKKMIGKVNLTRHLKTCKSKPVNTESTKIIFDSQEQFKQAVQKEIKEYLSNQPIHNNTYQTIHNNGTINILQINSFGNENMSHIDGEFLSFCIKNPKKGITALIENIHYNDDVPENKNLRFKSNKQNTFEQFTGGEWIECDASYTLDELIRKGYRLMNHHYINNFLNENPEYIEDPIKQSAVEKFRFLTDTKNIDYHLAKRNIRLLVKNKTYYVIASDESVSEVDSSSLEKLSNE
jgi:hypothetical protein